MQDLVISDTSCLILLSKLNRFELLLHTYGTVLIPPEVSSEYELQASIPLPDWISVFPPSPEPMIKFQFPGLDRGEQSAFALALEHPGALIIVDDRRSRTIAKRFGLRTTGTIGVLLAAKEAAVIPELKPLLDEVLGTDFYISPSIVERALKDANEFP